jgi:hypothetical protein
MAISECLCHRKTYTVALRYYTVREVTVHLAKASLGQVICHLKYEKIIVR